MAASLLHTRQRSSACSAELAGWHATLTAFGHVELARGGGYDTNCTHGVAVLMTLPSRNLLTPEHPAARTGVLKMNAWATSRPLHYAHYQAITSALTSLPVLMFLCSSSMPCHPPLFPINVY
ncbi:unnamed protein product [Sphacelaria rigidula]